MESTSNLGPDSQRARKRAWDRAAQRAARGRTKARIEHLEQQILLLKACGTESPSVAILEEIETLRLENHYLKAQIKSAISKLSTPFRGTPSHGGGAPNRHIGEFENVMLGPDEIANRSSRSKRNNVAPHETCASLGSSAQQAQWHGHGAVLIPGGGLARSPLYLSNGSEITSVRPACSLPISILESQAYYQSRCLVWCTLNDILSEVFTSELDDANCQTSAPGILFQGIVEGWDAIDCPDPVNPIVSILGRMDRYYWVTTSKIHRLAIAYKSYQLLMYILYPGSETRNAIPDWELPTRLQMSVQHPIAVDFFPWPAVRDELIAHYPQYLQTCGFFSDIHRYTHFNWPYRLEGSFSCDVDGNYCPSSLFIAHVNNLSNWTLYPVFFELYPEFIGRLPHVKPQGEDI